MPVRKHIRLKDYDYSKAGYYFITICVKDMQELLWRRDAHCASVGDAENPQLSDIGEVVKTAIENISHYYKAIKVDKYVIMPNHLHLIFVVRNDERRAMRVPTISTVVNQMKGYVSKELGHSIWQKRFHDHIIRDEADYQRIWQYIDENPARWSEDMYYSN